MNTRTVLTGKKEVSHVAALVAEVRDLVTAARNAAASAVNTLQVLTNFEIGRRIVEHEQKGARRAEYGAELLKALSARLTEEFGRGYSEDNLSLMRRFYLTWKERVAQFPNSLFGNYPVEEPKRVIDVQDNSGNAPKVSGKSNTPKIFEHPARKSPFALSWTHYVLLLTVKDHNERSFYEIEAANQGWSVPELKRQKASALYERLALSRDKNRVKRLAEEGQVIERPEDVLKEPYVLEFLGLDEKASFSESDLETAIIDHLEQFLLELGKGFLFESRQKRFTFDEDHFFVDLVFYNRLLRCYVLIDLKLDKLTHQDLGQMQMYVNYFDRHVRLPDENPTVGLLLCKAKKDAIVELTLPKDANIHASEYRLYLPSKALLRKKLIEWTAPHGAG